MLEGNIKLKLERDRILLVTEVNNRKVFELELDDDYYEHDTYSQAKNLMGQCMAILYELEGEDGMKEAIGEELTNNY